MKTRLQSWVGRVVLVTLFAVGGSFHAGASDPTPASNLAGIKTVREPIEVSLALKGASEFALDATEVAKIVRTFLATTSVSIAKSDQATPSIEILISGEASGGTGTGSYQVEILVKAILPSPFAKDRNIHAVLWRDGAKGSHILRYDSAAKELIKPSGALKERVYDSVREVSLRLASAFKAA